ncbi:MAG: type IV pilin protein [Burkholderiales bacterium]
MTGTHDRASGFTLVELMVVVAIVGLLVAIAIPSWGEHVTRASASAATGLLKELRARMEQRYADNRSYASGGGTACAIPDFNDADSGFGFACTTASGGQAFTWIATGSGRGAGFVYARAVRPVQRQPPDLLRAARRHTPEGLDRGDPSRDAVVPARARRDAS